MRAAAPRVRPASQRRALYALTLGNLEMPYYYATSAELRNRLLFLKRGRYKTVRVDFRASMNASGGVLYCIRRADKTRPHNASQPIAAQRAPCLTDVASECAHKNSAPLRRVTPREAGRFFPLYIRCARRPRGSGALRYAACFTAAPASARRAQRTNAAAETSTPGTIG